MEITKETQLGQTVEALSQRLHAHRIMSPRFRLSMPKNIAVKLLTTAYFTEVNSRGISYKSSKALDGLFEVIAGDLTAERGCNGMLFIGTCGSGKSTMLRAIHSMTRVLNEANAAQFPNILAIKEAKEIVVQCQKHSDIVINGEQPLLGIDDFGDEPKEVNDYGNVRTPLVDLLEYRYDRQKFTIITSNLTMDEIKKKYGVRILNRFAEMGRFYIFPQKSYRVPKMYNANSEE